MFLPVFVCLSVGLSVSEALKNACMDLDEMISSKSMHTFFKRLTLL